MGNPNGSEGGIIRVVFRILDIDEIILNSGILPINANSKCSSRIWNNDGIILNQLRGRPRPHSDMIRITHEIRGVF